MKKILIVHAHHEPKSFSSALANQAREVLSAAGHEVNFSDLYEMRFDPVSDRRNFSTTLHPEYLKQQLEEKHASEHNGFADPIESEIQKLEAADALIFNFPLWWFGMPAILKGWIDRVFAMGRVYGGPKLYEGGIGSGKKPAMVIMTTGGGPDAYGGYGVNPALEDILVPIHHGVFWFNGFLPLEPFVAWSPVRVSDEQRTDYLDSLGKRLTGLFSEEPRQLPPLADFPNFGVDRQKRFLLSVKAPDLQLRDAVARGKRQGWLKNAMFHAVGDLAHLQVRAPSRDGALQHVHGLEVQNIVELQPV